MPDRHESPDGTVCADPTDPPFIDALGHSYGLSEGGQLLIDGVLERDTAPCCQIAYAGRRAWCQDKVSRQWRSRGRHDHPWGPAGQHSPLPWDRFAIIEEAIVDLGTQLATVIDSQVVITATENAILQKLQNGGDNADVLDSIADLTTTMASNQRALLQAISEGADSNVQHAVQLLQDALADDYAAIVALLKQILAILTATAPTRLALDFPGESIATQSRPDKPGP